MLLHNFMYGWCNGLVAMAMVSIDDDVRDELRRYKAEFGLTYSEAIVKLLQSEGWADE